MCQENGVTDVTDVTKELIGYDGLSIPISRKNGEDWNLTLGEVYLALGAQVPVDGEWVDKPHKKWSEINSDLPAIDILAYGPPPTSGTRDAFVELAMHADANAMGIFGYAFLYENLDTLNPVKIEGVEPSADTIGDFSCPISRPQFFYVKNAHRGVAPNLNELIAEYVSDDALEPGGDLVERGFVSRT